MKFDLESFDENKAFRILAIIVAAVFLIYPFIIFLVWGKWESGGLFGDSFGMISSLFSSLAIILLIITLIIQKKEYRLTQEEFELSRKAQEQSKEALQKQANIMHTQNLENTLFQLLNAYSKNLQKLFIGTNESYIRPGSQTHKFILDHTMFEKRFFQKVHHVEEGLKIKMDKDLKRFYRSFSDTYRLTLEPYYNYIEIILRLINSFEERLKSFYFSLFLSYLDEREIINLQYYYLLCDKNTEFYFYLERFKVIDFQYKNHPNIVD